MITLMEEHCIECHYPLILEWTSLWGPDGIRHANCVLAINNMAVPSRIED